MYAAAAVTEIWIERQLHEQPKRSIITRAFLSYEKSCERNFNGYYDN